MVFRVRDRFDFAFPVIRASSSREPGACSAITRSRSRLPADSTLAKDSVEVNRTFGSSGAMRKDPLTFLRTSGVDRSVVKTRERRVRIGVVIATCLRLNYVAIATRNDLHSGGYSH